MEKIVYWKQLVSLGILIVNKLNIFKSKILPEKSSMIKRKTKTKSKTKILNLNVIWNIFISEPYFN